MCCKSGHIVTLNQHLIFFQEAEFMYMFSTLLLSVKCKLNLNGPTELTKECRVSFEYFVVNLSALLYRRPPKTGRAVLVFIIVYCTFDSEQ